MRRLKDGFRLLGQSFRVIAKDPELFLVMLGGLVLQTIVLAGLYLIVFRRAPEASDFRFPGILMVYPLMIVSGVVGTVTSGAVTAAAAQRLEGKDASVRDGFRSPFAAYPCSWRGRCSREPLEWS